MVIIRTWTGGAFLGMNINGRRLGAGWIGSDSNYGFSLFRDEYV